MIMTLNPVRNTHESSKVLPKIKIYVQTTCKHKYSSFHNLKKRNHKNQWA